MWITYDNQKLQDGLGAQTQRILSLYWIAKLHGWNYHHSPIICQRDHISSDVVEQFNHIIMLPDTRHGFVPHVMKEVCMEFIDINTLKRYTQSNVLFKITFPHQYIDAHFDILSNQFPYTFNWVQKKVNRPVTVAIHIRRGDVTPTDNCNRYVNADYYRGCAEYITTIFNRNHIPYEIHVHSEGNILPEIHNWRPILHMDENVCQTFMAFVNADILIAGFSSLSYSAAMLRNKGCVLYSPFWHQYSKRAIRIRRPNEILLYEKRIIDNL
jgi:hypothetical protein